MKNSVQRCSSDFQGLFRVKIRKMALGSNDLSTLPLNWAPLCLRSLSPTLSFFLQLWLQLSAGVLSCTYLWYKDLPYSKILFLDPSSSIHHPAYGDTHPRNHATHRALCARSTNGAMWWATFAIEQLERNFRSSFSNDSRMQFCFTARAT